MITVKLMGGLGNQMFQYALGRHLAIKNNCNLELDINYLKCKDEDNKRYFTEREFQLSHFNITAYLKKNNSGVFSKYRFCLIHREEPSKVIESGISFNPDILNYKGNLYIDGYWQSELYFTDIEEIIRKDFTFNSAYSPENKQIADLILSDNSVSLHVRRGDYVSNPIFSKVLGTCPVSYYQKAVDLVKSEISNPLFFVFSDDILWAKQNLSFINSNIAYVEINNEMNCHEDLRLMSLCKHNIIANSSFSWWGAWLNASKRKLIIAPERWFNDISLESKDLIPENWIKL
jgi:hypothetical protein